MYGLPQAGKISNDELVKHLEKFGYKPCKRTPGLWRHTSRPISFALVVDDFAIKYVGNEHLQHLKRALESKYEITHDMKAEFFCGMDLEWNYKRRQLKISMKDYIKNLMHKIQHPPPNKPEHNPHNWTPPKYGQTIQLAPLSDNLPILPVARIKRVQQIIGSLLYYARAVDNTILLTLNNIAAEQSQATTDTERQIHKLLNYVATHHNASITYKASDMILKIHSDANYLSAKN